MESHKVHVPNHQPDIKLILLKLLGEDWCVRIFRGNPSIKSLNRVQTSAPELVLVDNVVIEKTLFLDIIKLFFTIPSGYLT